MRGGSDRDGRRRTTAPPRGPHLQRARQSGRAGRARLRRSPRRRDPGGRRRLAGRHGGPGARARPRAAGRSTSSSAAASAGSGGPTSPASSGASPRDTTSWGRWTPTSPTIRPTSRPCSPRSPIPAEADVVIGSRYVAGGGTVHWGLYRRLLSRSANRFSARLLGLAARDLTSGFRLYRASALAAIDLADITSTGYSFLVELLARLQAAGARIAESPIVFADRREGRSKLSLWRDPARGLPSDEAPAGAGPAYAAGGGAGERPRFAPLRSLGSPSGGAALSRLEASAPEARHALRGAKRDRSLEPRVSPTGPHRFLSPRKRGFDALGTTLLLAAVFTLGLAAVGRAQAPPAQPAQDTAPSTTQAPAGTAAAAPAAGGFSPGAGPGARAVGEGGARATGAGSPSG